MKYKLDNNSNLWNEGVGGCSRQVWRCGRSEACSLSSSLKVLCYAGWGVGPSGLVAGNRQGNLPLSR